MCRMIMYLQYSRDSTWEEKGQSRFVHWKARIFTGVLFAYQHLVKSVSSLKKFRKLRRTLALVWNWAKFPHRRSPGHKDAAALPPNNSTGSIAGSNKISPKLHFPATNRPNWVWTNHAGERVSRYTKSEINTKQKHISYSTLRRHHLKKVTCNKTFCT